VLLLQQGKPHKDKIHLIHTKNSYSMGTLAL
jgi:hypothetical protein